MLGDDDRQLEYDRLCHSLDKDKIMAFARQSALMATMQPRQRGGIAPLSPNGSGGTYRVSHLVAVSELAVRYVEILYSAEDRIERRYRARVCEAAGLLHETMLQSCGFEDVVDLADESVATIVSAVTPDVRLPLPKRIKLLTNQVGLAGADAQLVLLADLRHEYVEYSERASVDPEGVKQWAESTLAVLSHMRALVDTPLHQRLSKLRGRLLLLQSQTRGRRSRPKAVAS